MPLQIRRGTEIERLAMTIPLAEGELLWITDEQKLYIGNGTSLAGVLSSVTGYTDENAQDAAGALFANGVHTGITFNYGVTQDGADRIDATINLSSYNGPIKGDLSGSVFADTSTLIIDGTNGKVNLDGTINGNVIPDTNEAYDLGSLSYRFRDLYLSGSSIYLGNATISASGNAVDLPIGSTIGGQPLGGFIDDYKGNIIGDDSSIMVNTSTYQMVATGGFIGTLFGNVIGNTTGFHLGDIKGSVFSDDSGTVIDSITKTVYANVLNLSQGANLDSAPLTCVGTFVQLGDSSNPVELQIDGDSTGSGLRLLGLTETFGGSNPSFDIRAYRGTSASPEIIQDGDSLGIITLSGFDGTAYSAGGFISAVVEDASITPGSPFDATIRIGSFNGFLANKFLSIDSQGIASASVIQTGVYTDTPETRPTGVKGMIIFNDTTGKFQGHDGTTWVDLS